MSAQLSLAFAEHPAVKTVRLSAKDEIRRVLADSLPPDVPPFFARIVSASFTGKKSAIGELEMFDGAKAEIEVWQWRPDSSAYRWVRLDGGDLTWEGGRWKRVAINDFSDGVKND
jgi:hypothetical protein